MFSISSTSRIEACSSKGTDNFSEPESCQVASMPSNAKQCDAIRSSVKSRIRRSQGSQAESGGVRERTGSSRLRSLSCGVQKRRWFHDDSMHGEASKSGGNRRHSRDFQRIWRFPAGNLKNRKNLQQNMALPCACEAWSIRIWPFCEVGHADLPGHTRTSAKRTTTSRNIWNYLELDSLGIPSSFYSFPVTRCTTTGSCYRVEPPTCTSPWQVVKKTITTNNKYLTC